MLVLVVSGGFTSSLDLLFTSPHQRGAEEEAGAGEKHVSALFHGEDSGCADKEEPLPLAETRAALFPGRKHAQPGLPPRGEGGQAPGRAAGAAGAEGHSVVLGPTHSAHPLARLRPPAAVGVLQECH